MEIIQRYCVPAGLAFFGDDSPSPAVGTASTFCPTVVAVKAVPEAAAAFLDLSSDGGLTPS